MTSRKGREGRKGRQDQFSLAYGDRTHRTDGTDGTNRDWGKTELHTGVKSGIEFNILPPIPLRPLRPSREAFFCPKRLNRIPRDCIFNFPRAPYS